MNIISVNGWGVPQRTRDAFDILHSNDLIDNSLCRKLKAMVGFRNIAVHDYQESNIEIIKSITENNLEGFILFKNIALSSNPE